MPLHHIKILSRLPPGVFPWQKNSSVKTPVL